MSRIDLAALLLSPYFLRLVRRELRLASKRHPARFGAFPAFRRARPDKSAFD
jgi:hypothetical protein